MMTKLYMDEVKKQLTCNASNEFKQAFITYKYTNDQIDDNKDYFVSCKDDGLSPYVALLFFDEYLKNQS